MVDQVIQGDEEALELQTESLTAEVTALKAELTLREAEKQKRLRLIDTLNTQAAAARKQIEETMNAQAAAAQNQIEAKHDELQTEMAQLRNDCESAERARAAAAEAVELERRASQENRRAAAATLDALSALEDAHTAKAERLEKCESERTSLHMQSEQTIGILKERVGLLEGKLAQKSEQCAEGDAVNLDLKQLKAKYEPELNTIRRELQAPSPPLSP